MTKRKIAVFATGWGADILAQFMRGMRDVLIPQNTDIYLFLNYVTVGSSEEGRHGELNIFSLPNLKDFDGAVIISNLIDYPEEIKKIIKKCHDAGIPVISHGVVTEGAHNVITDNLGGMCDLVEHLILQHGVKKIAFLAGDRINGDSNERLEAIRTTCAKHNVPFGDDNIVYTYWDLGNARNAVKHFYESGNFPDAFICANDEIAMVSIVESEKLKLRVPEDIIVTGFDCIPQAQTFYPNIASVDQNSAEHGRVCAKELLNLIEGGEANPITRIPCTFIPGESCGCECDPETADRRLRLGTTIFNHTQAMTASSWHTLHIERLIINCESYNEIKKNLTDVLSTDHSFEGNNFHVIFDPASYRSEAESGSQPDIVEYNDKMDVIFSLRNGKVQNIRSINVRTLIPGISDTDDPHMYVFLPVHEREIRIGYIVFTDCYDELESRALRDYMERFMASMEKSRKAMYLRAINDSIRELSHVDALTHVKNRAAYESRLEEIRRKAQHSGKVEFGIVLFDINNLKKINDELGHYAGDEYIKNACRLICITYKNSPVYRIGGDEFVVILEGKPFARREELLTSFVQEMNKLMSSDIPAEERVSVAYGMSIHESSGESIDDVVKRADEIMYETKKKMKAKK